MYGLPQAGIIPQQLLEKQLNKKGYHQSEIIPGLWKHKWRPIYLSLCVDDFGVIYIGKNHVYNLMSFLREYYEILQYWKVKRYLGLDLDWDYSHGKVHLSSMLYVTDAQKIFQHDNPWNLQHQPYPHIQLNYEVKAQYAEAVDVSPTLSIADNIFVQ